MSKKALTDFNNWTPADDNDIVGIIGLKWADKTHENYTTHSFYDSDEIKDVYFHRLTLREVLCSVYDKSHENPLDANSEEAAAIMEIVRETIDKVVKL